MRILVLCVLAIVSACVPERDVPLVGPSDGGPVVDGGPVGDGGPVLPACEEIGGRIAAWLEARSSCEIDADCTSSPTYCGVPTECGNYLYFHRNPGPGLSDLIDEWNGQSCSVGLDCNLACASATPPGCIEGKCGPAPR